MDPVWKESLSNGNHNAGDKFPAGILKWGFCGISTSEREIDVVLCPDKKNTLFCIWVMHHMGQSETNKTVKANRSPWTKCVYVD